jgi:hypothetical protein
MNTSRYNGKRTLTTGPTLVLREATTAGLAGERGDTFIANPKQPRKAMLPSSVDWWPSLSERSKLASFSIGYSAENDWQWFPDAGNGTSQSTGQFVVGNIQWTPTSRLRAINKDGCSI